MKKNPLRDKFPTENFSMRLFFKKKPGSKNYLKLFMPQVQHMVMNVFNRLNFPVLKWRRRVPIHSIVLRDPIIRKWNTTSFIFIIIFFFSRPVLFFARRGT